MNELFAPPESGLLISYLRVSLEDENTGESESISNQRDLIGCYLKQHPEFTAYKVMGSVLYLSTTAMTATNTLAQPGAWTLPAKLWFTIFTAGIFPER